MGAAVAKKPKSRLKTLRRAYGGGTYAAIETLDGKKHAYLNAAVPMDRQGQPVAPLDHAVCQTRGRCGHAYAILMVSGDTVCEECRWEDVALFALAILLEWGVNLGVSNHRGGDTEEERESRARLMRERARHRSDWSGFIVRGGRGSHPMPSRYGYGGGGIAGYESDGHSGPAWDNAVRAIEG